MDTLLFYVKNGEKPELPIIIRSRTHSSLCLVLGRSKNMLYPFEPLTGKILLDFRP